MRRTLTAAIMLVLTAFAGNALAININPNDNILAPDGYYGLVYGEWYSADRFNDKDGDKLADADLNVMVTLLRPIYYFHIGSLPVAMQAIIPFGKVSERDMIDESSSGVGDVVVGPGAFLYTNADTATYLSLWLFVTAPTGKWDEDQTVNLGGHHWYFEPQLAVNQTWGQVVFDMNLNYYIHMEEPTNDYQAPNRFEIETSLVYNVTPALALGINGGGYWDMSDAKVDGETIDDTKATRIQFGPTLAYQINDKMGFNLRWTNDLVSKNDFQGNDVWARLSYAF